MPTLAGSNAFTSAGNNVNSKAQYERASWLRSLIFTLPQGAFAIKIPIITIKLSGMDQYNSYIIGHSENSACPNLKKLILPASTTAMTMIFFPLFKAANGFGFRAGGADGVDGNAHGNSLRINEGPTIGTTGVGGGGAGGSGAPVGERRCRGLGRGASGRT